MILLSGAPEAWFRPGAVISATGAPTLHGDVSFRLEVGGACAVQSLTLEWNCARAQHQDPAELLLCLPVALGQRLGLSGEVHGPHLRVSLPEDSGRMTFTAPDSFTEYSSTIVRNTHV